MLRVHIWNTHSLSRGLPFWMARLFGVSFCFRPRGLLTLHTFRSVGPVSAEANALMHEYMLHVCGIGRRLIKEFVHRKGKTTHYRERERERVVIYLEWWELFIEETKK